jgi:hypothetical protein
MLNSNRATHERVETSSISTIATNNNNANNLEDSSTISNRPSEIININENLNANNQVSQVTELSAQQPNQSPIVSETSTKTIGEYVPTFSDLERKKLNEQLRNVISIDNIFIGFFFLIKEFLTNQACSTAHTDMSGLLLFT